MRFFWSFIFRVPSKASGFFWLTFTTSFRLRKWRNLVERAKIEKLCKLKSFGRFTFKWPIGQMISLIPCFCLHFFNIFLFLPPFDQASCFFSIFLSSKFKSSLLLWNYNFQNHHFWKFPLTWQSLLKHSNWALKILPFPSSLLNLSHHLSFPPMIYPPSVSCLNCPSVFFTSLSHFRLYVLYSTLPIS